jgi:hypothetical protein
MDLAEQGGSYDLGGYSLDYLIDLAKNLVRLTYRSELRILDENNISTTFSGGSFYGHYSYIIAANFKTRQLVMNGKVCVRHHDVEKFHCREYADIIIGSW